MKKIYIIPLVVLAWLGFSIMDVISETGKPTLATTGGPGEGLCTDCHGGQPNTGLGTVTYTLGSNGDNRYFNGATDGDNRIDLTVTSSGKRKFGFELTALDKNNKQCGYFWSPNIFVDSGYSTSNKRYYGFHSMDGATFPNVGGGQWTIMWRCPPDYTDPVHFYTSFVESNEDGTTDGDRVYTRHDTAFVDPTVAIAMAKKNPMSFNAFVTANNKLQVSFEPTAATNVLVDLFNMNGQKVQNLISKRVNPGATEQTLDMPTNIASGLYLISCESNGTRVVKKVFLN